MILSNCLISFFSCSVQLLLNFMVSFTMCTSFLFCCYCLYLLFSFQCTVWKFFTAKLSRRKGIVLPFNSFLLTMIRIYKDLYYFRKVSDSWFCRIFRHKKSPFFSYVSNLFQRLNYKFRHTPTHNSHMNMCRIIRVIPQRKELVFFKASYL